MSDVPRGATIASTLESVGRLAPLIREHTDSIDRERLLPKPVVRGLADAGVFRLLVPRSLGGDELEPMMACRFLGRRIRTASQHLQVMPTNYEVAGQLFLGADMSATTWSRDSRATDRERRRDT